jgi:hypothetical protein
MFITRTDRRIALRMRHLLRRLLLIVMFVVPFIPAGAQDVSRERALLEKRVDVGRTGIDVKRPVFAGACKACPWGVLASVTQTALKSYGYDVQICWVCWSTFGPREMADKTKPVLPPGAEEDATYIEPPPDAIPDISATSEVN